MQSFGYKGGDKTNELVNNGWRDTPFFRGMRDRHVQVLMAYDMGRFLP
jgi:hypothetical protein